MKLGRFSLALIVLSLLLIPMVDVDASSHGREGSSESGCSRHGAAAGENGAAVQIQGIPEQYTAGESYELTITLEGGPAADTARHQGGFNLKASVCKLAPLDTTTWVTETGELTHDHSGANQREWTVKWTAPLSDENATFTIAGNIVDGDHQPTDGDDWALASYTSAGGEYTYTDVAKAKMDTIVIVLLFGVPLIFLLLRKKK